MRTLTTLSISMLAVGAVSTALHAQPADPTPTQPPPIDPTPADPTTTDPVPTDSPTVDTPPVVIPTPDPITAPAPPPAPSAEATTDDPSGALSGFSIAAGGGFGAFTDDDLRASTSGGGDWDVRLTLGTRSNIAVEGAYFGSAQAIDALGLDSNAMLISNGIQGNVRLNLLAEYPLQPFLFAGAAWRHYNVVNTSTNTSDIADDDSVLELPVGVGFAYRMGGVVVDARGEFRGATNEDLLVPTTSLEPRAPMHRYGVNATVGYEF